MPNVRRKRNPRNNGHFKDCHILISMTNNITLLTTEKIGRLTPIKSLNKTDKRYRVIWLFKCDCGNEVEITASDVRLRRKLSCGCLGQERKDTLGDRLRIINTKPDKDGPLTKLFGSYKRAAIRRGYEWNLSKSEFKSFLSKNCFYCAAVPATGICIARQKTEENTLVYNGIDRKNNTVGYTLDNCITACHTCNRMKMNLSYDEFMKKIKQIHDTHYDKQ